MQQLYLCLILEAYQTSHLQLFVARIIPLKAISDPCLLSCWTSSYLCPDACIVIIQVSNLVEQSLKHWITTASTFSSLQHHTLSSIDCWSQELNSPWGELLHFCLISHFPQHLIPALIHRPHFFSSLAISPFPNKLLKGNPGPFYLGGLEECIYVRKFTEGNKIKLLFSYGPFTLPCAKEWVLHATHYMPRKKSVGEREELACSPVLAGC